MKRHRALPKSKPISTFQFILDDLSGLELRTRPMFGCTAVYVGEKIVLVFCDREKMKEDIGIWVCIPDIHTEAMKRDFPALRGVSFFENENSAWQCLPQDNPEFEELALQFCAMIRKKDPRIGRVPKPKRTKKSTK